MIKFKDLSTGTNLRHRFYIASRLEAVEAIKSDAPGHEYYIVRSLLAHRFHIYINLIAIPNGIGEYGKIYEGRNKKAAINALEATS